MIELPRIESFQQTIGYTRTITLGNSVAAIFFAYLAYDTASHEIVWAWLIYMLLFGVARQVYSQSIIFEKISLAELKNKYWIYAGFVALSAMGWGATGPLFLNSTSSFEMQMYVVVFTIGIVAGSIFSLAAMPSYFFLFIGIISVSIIFTLISIQSYSLATMVLIFFLFSMRSGKQVQEDNARVLDLNQQNLALINELKQVNKLKSEFLANMSHEIRTPMNAILGFIQLLKEKETDADKLQYLNTIGNSGKDLLQIINDILDFSKIESNQLTIEHIAFNPKQRISMTAELFESQANTKHIELKVILAPKIPETIQTDPTRLVQVISNLLSNAIKFSEEGGAVQLSVDYDLNRQALKVSVQDNGIGIPANKLEHIFEAFTQADNSTTRKYGGTGLGLSICANLINKMGGVLAVESEVGEGSRFYFQIPAPVIEITHEQNEQPSTPLAIENLHGHILIVEDNPTNQLLIRKLIEKTHLTYDLASDGVEAIEKFQQNQYQLILMDENMPNLNGIKATEAIRKIEQEHQLKETPIIALTASSMKDDRIRFLACGMNEYLTKPINVTALYETLLKFIH